MVPHRLIERTGAATKWRPVPASRARRENAPSEATPNVKGVFVNELKDGAEIDQVLLVREAERRQRRDGGDYLRLRLGDRTGAVVAMVWEELLGEIEDLVRAGEAVRVRGRYTVHPRFGPQINLRELQAPAPGSYSPEDLRDGPAHTVGELEAQLRELLDTVHRPHLRELLERLIGEDSELWGAYRMAPAAKHYHQAYPHGLLEHCLSVAQAVGATSATFGGIDRDVAVTGALLHDIGKLEAYTEEGGRVSTSPTPGGCRARSRSATTGCGARSSRSRTSPPSWRRRSPTSSSPTTAPWSTAARSCRARARRRSCT